MHLYSTLSWGSYTNTITAKMGRGVCLIRRYSPFLFPKVIQVIGLSHLDCSVIWSSAAKKELEKLQLVQNKAHN